MNIGRLPRLLRIPWRATRADVDDELRFHMEMAAADLVAHGIHPAVARAEAERRFGTVTDIRDACLTIDERRRRHAARSDFMSALLLDLRHAARSLRKTPMLTVVGSLTLMLGVGSTTAIFSVVDGVLLRPLPYVNAERLVWIADGQENSNATPMSYPEFADWQKRGTQIFEDVGAWFSTALTLTGVDQPVVLRGQRVSASMPRLLGVRPILGRTFLPDEDTGNGQRVIMLSSEAWRRQFNGDSSIIGRTLNLAGYPFVVIGVYPSGPRTRLPNELSSPRHSDYWQALRLDETRAPRGLHFMSVMGRVRPGLSLDAMNVRMNQITTQLIADSVTLHGAHAVDLSTQLLGPSRPMLVAIFGAVLLVLLVACANVANLLLARAAGRQREIAIRTALGAGRSRIMTQLLGESVLRALLGGLLGVALAYGSIAILQRSMSVRLPRFADVSIDGGVLAFAIGLSLLTGIAFGLVPALRSAKTDATAVMREGGRGIAGSLRRDVFRRSLIVGELVLSFVLLAGAGLLVRSFERLMNVPKGFNPDRLVTASVTLPRTRYADSVRQIAFYRELLERVRAIPGVASAAVTSDLPVQTATNGGVTVEGRTYAPGTAPIAEKRYGSSDYFATIGARLVAGRFFNEADVMEAPHVAVVNEAFVAKNFPGESAIGKRVDFGWETTGLQTIVGVVANVREQPLNGDLTPAIYLPVAQRSSEFMYLVVRSSVDELSLIPAIRRELKAIDGAVPLENVRTFNDIIAEGVSTQRLTTSLLSSFSMAALLLAAIGLYGVISYSVAQRTQELGIRAALGAQRSELLGDVLREGMAFVLVGVALGALAARGAAQFIASQLFGVSVGDPLVYGSVALLLGIVSVIALLAPAVRAARVDPVIALREE